MALRTIALGVALGACGRFGLEGSARDAPDDESADGPGAGSDAASPGGGFGTVKAERAVAGDLIDIDRIAVTPTAVLVATNAGVNTLHTFDHALAPLAGPTSIVPPSNVGISYDPTTGQVYGYQNATTNSQIANLTLAGTVVVGPIGSGVTGGSGFVDPQGHLHIPTLNGAGFREYDGALALVGTWGTIVNGDPARVARQHDRDDHAVRPLAGGPPTGTSFVITLADGVQVDARQSPDLRRASRQPRRRHDHLHRR